MSLSAEEIGRRRKWPLLAAMTLLALPAVELRARAGEGVTETPASEQGGIIYTVNTASNTVLVGACENGGAGCSLRGAIQAANSHPGADGISIVLPAGSSILLSTALPDITESVIISFAGPNQVNIQRNGGGGFRIFNVLSSGPVTFSGLVIGFGNPLPTGGGGGISNSSGSTVNVTNCILRGNNASGSGGGGILNSTNGTLNITDCSFDSNQAIGDGGAGIYNPSGGTVNITRSIFYDNRAGGGGFGGPGSGGGIYNGGTLNVTNSTFVYNVATLDFGGGIYNTGSGTVNLSNSTIARNQAGAGLGGGGVFNSSTSTVTVRSSIIALSTNNPSDVSGLFISSGFNLIGNNNNASGSFPAGNPNANNDIVGTLQSPIDPKVDPNGARNNGGPTLTLALLPDSPAIDQGTSNGLTGNLTTDQRGPGYARTFDYPFVANRAGGNGSDIGAFEFGVPFGLSRKMHGAVAFDINLPPTGTAGIECRAGGVNGQHQVVVTFPAPLFFVVDAAVTTGTGSVNSFNVSDAQVIVNLTGVADAQTIVLTLGVSDGMITTNYSLPMDVLEGDTNADRLVNSGDSLPTRSRAGQAASPSNFRSDVNTDGFINSGDTAVVRARSGAALP